MKPRRAVVLVGMVLSLAGLLSFDSGCWGAEAVRPNIVMIVADDLGWADLGCYGNRFNESPRIDQLAKQGTRFTNFYAAAPVCSPTRASLQTGQYQARFGLTAHIPGHWRPFEKLVEPPNALALPREAVTLGETFRETGYATGYFGKWHLGGKGPGERGYGTAFEFTGHVVPPARQQPRGKEAWRAADYLAEMAVAFIEANQKGPFLLQVHPFAVHIPLTTTAEREAKYRAKARVEGYSCHPIYAGLLEELDACVGKILAALDRLKLAEQTLVVFTSDNGGLEREVGGWPGTLNRPLRNEKGSLYEGGIRVPLIVRWPGVTRPGTVTDAVAASIDFAPTFHEVGRVKREQGQAWDGVSLLPVLRDPKAPLGREALYWHYPHYHHSRPSGAIRQGDWKVIEFYDTGEVELYNLEDDLSEATNRAEQRPDKAQALRQKLVTWRDDVNAQMPQQNPAYDPERAGEWWNRRTVAPTSAPGTYKPEKGKR